MEQWFLSSEWLSLSTIRVFCFAFFFTMLFSIEYKFPWREHKTSYKTRLVRHFSLIVISTVLVNFLFRAMIPMAVAQSVATKNLGFLRLPELSFLNEPLRVILGVILLDLTIYFQHRLFHKYRLLWRMHRMHHTDKMIDVSTGIRFHPFEMVISMGIKIMAVALIGVPVLAVLLFEILLNLASMFTHTNVKIPHHIEKYLRLILVTPSMHRIHHSDILEEHNSNFGFLFSIWDRLFSTYRAQPQLGELKMVFGLEDYRDPKYQTLLTMLLTPFVNVKKRSGKKEKLYMEPSLPKKKSRGMEKPKSKKDN